MRAAVLFAMLAFLGHPPASAEQPTVKVEFRRAEATTAPGLTKAAVPGFDDPIYLYKDAEITNVDIASVKVGPADSGYTGYYKIDLTMTDEGARKLRRLSREHLNRTVAILIDGQVLTAPRIRSEMSSQAQFNGLMDEEEATRIANGILGKSSP